MIDTVKNCVGCYACASICPKHAIDKQKDRYGFDYPIINYQKCIECNLCEKVCPALADIPLYPIDNAFAVMNKNDEVRNYSSSGGVFYALAKSVIDDGGVVFGAAFDENWQVKHIACDNLDLLDSLLRSKYVQSDTSGVFEKVKTNLEEGRTVLFCGTPCQCNALSLFAGKEYKNLCLIDFICHGVPSPAVWKQYLNSVARNKEIKNINFRNKDTGWQSYCFHIDYMDSSRFHEKYYENTYMKLFLSDLILRSSCYDCPSKFPNKKADLTLGDLWGADSLLPSHDNKGVSLVIINSSKGQKLLDRISNTITMESVNAEDAFGHNPSARRSVGCPDMRKKCLNELVRCEPEQFHKIATKYTSDSLLRKVLRVSKRTVKKIIKK